MAQVTEYGWNGVVIAGDAPGNLPSAAAPAFVNATARGIKRIRVPLDPRTVMPVGTTTIPQAIKDKLTLLSDAAAAAGVTIQYALLADTYPTSATASRRPRLADLTTFWGAVSDHIGAHSATLGFAIMTKPVLANIAAANADTASSMSTWANVALTASTAPAWLEEITRQTVTYLRTTKSFNKQIYVPLLHSATSLVDNHAAPWVADNNVYYEAHWYPTRQSGELVTQPYTTYTGNLSGLGLRASWSDTAYITQGASTTAGLLNAELLAIPTQESLATSSLPSYPRRAKAYVNGTWKACAVKNWNGSAWVERQVRASP